jgi:hypothetical protein
MFDLRKEKIEVECDCGRTHTPTFQDAIIRKVISCTCGIDIQLSDNNNSVKKSVTDMNKAFRDLENTFKKFGK